MDIVGIIGSLAVGDWIAIATVTGSGVVAAPRGLLAGRNAINRRFFRFIFPYRKVRVFIPSRDMGRPMSVVAREDLETFQRLKGVLERQGFEVELDFVDPTGELYLKEDESNFVICGPKNSYMIRNAFAALTSIEIRESGPHWEIFDKITGNTIKSPMDADPPKNADIAFFGKVQLPDMPSTPIVLACGIHALGSLGVAAFLESRGEMLELLKRVESSNFYCLIRSRYSEVSSDIIESDLYFMPRKL